VYELFSILNHYGGAYGGHYYAFVKSFEDSNWHCFNDMSVSKIDPEELPLRAFGTQSSNAYMLFFRQVEDTENYGGDSNS
jgi:ubiquitin carboxyl-terminal hydrolase 47